VLIAATVALTACSTAEFTPADPTKRFPPYEGEISVLKRLPPPSQFQQVGVVLVSGVNLTSQSKMVNALKKEAAKRGANAIVLQSNTNSLIDGSGGKQKRLAAWAIIVPR
jgi:hypothetical protein